MLQSVHLTIIPIPHYTHFIAGHWWKKALPRKSADDVKTSQKETIPREGAILANILQRRCSLRKELKIWSWCGKHGVLSLRDESPREEGPRASMPAELQEESEASLNDVLHGSQLGWVTGKRTVPAQNCILLLVELKVSESDNCPSGTDWCPLTCAKLHDRSWGREHVLSTQECGWRTPSTAQRKEKKGEPVSLALSKPNRERRNPCYLRT